MTNPAWSKGLQDICLSEASEIGDEAVKLDFAVSLFLVCRLNYWFNSKDIKKARLVRSNFICDILNSRQHVRSQIDYAKQNLNLFPGETQKRKKYLVAELDKVSKRVDEIFGILEKPFNVKLKDEYTVLDHFTAPFLMPSNGVGLLPKFEIKYQKRSNGKPTRYVEEITIDNYAQTQMDLWLHQLCLHFDRTSLTDREAFIAAALDHASRAVPNCPRINLKPEALRSRVKRYRKKFAKSSYVDLNNSRFNDYLDLRANLVPQAVSRGWVVQAAAGKSKRRQ
jgi:hypothetical protein